MHHLNGARPEGGARTRALRGRRRTGAMSLLAAASGGWLVLGHASRASARTVDRNIAWPVLAVFYFIFLVCG